MANRFQIFRRPASLALRVTTLVGIATTLVFLGFNWIIVDSLEQHFVDMDVGELRVIADAVINALHEVQAGADSELLARAVSGHHGVFYYVADIAGNTFYAKTDGPDLSRIAANHRPVTVIDAKESVVWREGGESYRGAVLRVDSGSDQDGNDHLVAVAMNIDFHLSFLQSFKLILWWATCIVLCIALLVAWSAIQWGHIPIRKVNAKISAIGSSGLHIRLNPKEVPIELEELVASFNDMLGRIEDGFARLSNFSADIAHELRTPITNLTTQTEVALGQARSSEEYQEVLYSNLEEFGRMGRMIGDMLFLAQTENAPDDLRLTNVDLMESIRGLFEYFEAWAEDRGVSLSVEGRAEPVRADRELLRRALGNLLSNAIRYTPPGAAVMVRLSQNQRSTTVSVENPGKKIPVEDLPRIFDRFYRVDPSRQRKDGGVGLGLAIVKSIVEAHGGQVRVSSDDALTRFEVTLPRSS